MKDPHVGKRKSKVLIVGQPFNNYSGGGITLSNLFRGWSSSDIAVVSTGHNLHDVTTDICDTYYQLGSEEYKWKFPFSLLQRSFPSGLLKISSLSPGVKGKRASLRHNLVHEYFYPLLKWLGLFHTVHYIEISDRFKLWVQEFKPDLLYFQVSSRFEIRFANSLIDSLGVPAALHIMDDWPSTISRYGILKRYWSRRIDSEFRLLMGKCSLLLSIGEAMSKEYLVRYGREFIPFHNPIETSKWSAWIKKDYDISKDNIKILYSGRIGIGISHALVEAAMAIESLNSMGLYGITFHIQSPTLEKDILDDLTIYGCVKINPVADLEELPRIYSEADILLLANDFSSEGMSFLRYSMPTKASEYMISGTPVIVYAPAEAAVSLFFRTHECGLCVSEQGVDSLAEGLKRIIEDSTYRQRIAGNAVRLASERFDASRVRELFQESLMNVAAVNKV